MSWATRRKIIYFLIVLAILGVVIGYPIYKINYVPPSCMDNKQNQGEEGVDCGGPCSLLCQPLELAPVVLWQQVFEVTPHIYTATAYVENPNVGGEAMNVPYTFSLYDEANALIGTRKGTAHIPPGRKFAIVETNIQSSVLPARTFFEFDKNIPWRVARTLPKVAVNNILYSSRFGPPTVDADIMNLTDTRIGKIDMSVILYDSNGNAFAASKTYVDSLDSSATEHVTFTWPRAFSKTVANVEIIPDIE